MFGFVSRLTILSLLVIVPGSALAQTIAVDGPAELREALVSAPAGSTILLAPGDYGDLRLRGDINAEILRSAEAGDPARFSSVDVRDVADLTFEDLLFDYSFTPGDRNVVRPFIWRGSRNLTLRNNIFEGDVAHGVSADADGHGTGMGLMVWDSEDVLIEGNEIFTFFKGLHVRRVTNAVVRGNEIRNIRSDGMNFAQVAHVLIEGNLIHNFDRALDSGDHADMIQFWTARTDWASHDIVIRGNVLNSGQGLRTQSIFMRNERSDTGGSGDLTLFYRNFLIEENVIINAHTHGITVGDAIGVTVRRNTLVQNPGSADGDPASGLYIPIIRIAEVNRDVEVIDNITARVVGYLGQDGWLVANNLAVQNQSPQEPGFYGDVFVGHDLDHPDSFRYRPGGPADQPGLGAPMLR